MKIAVISSAIDAAPRLNENYLRGFITFIYHTADPKHSLLRDKFLYVHDETELNEKVNLLKADVTVRDLLRL